MRTFLTRNRAWVDATLTARLRAGLVSGVGGVRPNSLGSKPAARAVFDQWRHGAQRNH